MDESQAKKKKALNKSTNENYSWADILQNVHTPSLQEQAIQQSLTPLVYHELLVNTCMSGMYFSI